MRNIAGLLADAAIRWPAARALTDTTAGTSFTWSELNSAVENQARRLLERGLGTGDRVALRLPTSADFAIALFAVARAGGVAVPVSPLAPEAELTCLLEHSGARLVLDREALRSSAEPGEPVEPSGGDEDIAVLSYTSGTTGPSRGVMLSHRALLANVEQVGAVPGTLRHGDRVFIAIPLFHVYGLGPGLLHAAAVGATAVLAERFDVVKALEVCAAHRVTVIGGVPAMYAEFARMSAEQLGEGLATVRLLSSGAAPLHPKVLASIREKTGLEIFEGYGLTEAAPVVTSTLVTGYAKPGSVGRPVPGVELRLVESDGLAEPVPLDPDDLDDAFVEDEAGTGLVSVRGANLFSGYWPDGAHGPDEDGWFRTGDVGYLDTDGDLHLVDRANDLIIVNGFNVFPHEVEEVIVAMPEVAEVAVVGMVDERSGESVRAVVVPAQGASLSEQQVMDHCAEHLAGYKVPTTIEFAETLPHSPVGKLRRVPPAPLPPPPSTEALRARARFKP
ncbi:AMP-binding protein [Amycolatopsis alkalitolerans]|uniref:Long-chain fatty acid--CoA ligase n=1 Tax=Amycolatopsis alkalitolerans TaxID=2547244 RepID=A0A5C4MAP3_9PSEU|nr:AMP-binding protein [Amycolatopsis alkalitolerans]TNC28560.1 long-chain fatty acid--CoA ligase [Amycolatopsis alkalitolerans]